MTTEQRTEEYTVQRQTPALLLTPSSGTKSETVTLDAPKSAGAIARQIAKVISPMYPEPRYDFKRSAKGTLVDFEQRTPVDGKKVSIHVDIEEDDPKKFKLTTGVVLETLDETAADNEAKTLWSKLEEELSKPAP